MSLFLISFLLFSILMTSDATFVKTDTMCRDTPCTEQTDKMCRDSCVRKGYSSGRCKFYTGMFLQCRCDPEGRI
ncbi:unnamed protein product [Cylicocyclus nassatus]|uniref:Uncharacterized protein n=1 Tax=Cylicocyclus nassatus TaxID=53992 RepID=A0AA36M1U2_CYLNA|nr:unnamed protein product [Cylicocyclus nassatus]